LASANLLKKYAFSTEEEAELVSGVKEKTGFPEPTFRYRIVEEAMNAYMEEAYFWTIDELKLGWSFNKFLKLTDIHAASAHSTFFGVAEQRLGLQQEKVSQYLRGISEMLKALFQLVRELRVIDERLGYYEHSFKRKLTSNDDDAAGSDITLKGVWVDQVEGGTKNAASVYGLAQTVGFSVLPDLFFRVRVNDIGAHEKKPEEYNEFVKEVVSGIDEKVDAMEGFNEKVKEVLKRKIVQYYMWKMRTYKELDARKKFSLKYLRQHYDTIKLYTGWVKPYLKNIERLQMAEKLLEKDKAPELINSFEGALAEVEVLSYKKKPDAKFHPCVLVNIFYRTTPSLSYVGEGYQRGPAHTGKFDLVLRGYVWSDEQITNYQRMKDEEDLEMLSMIDRDIKEAMDSLGDELKNYLKDAGEKFTEEDGEEEDEDKEKKKEKDKNKPSVNPLEPFTGVLGGVKELFSAFGGIKGSKEKKPNLKKQITGGKNNIELSKEIDEAKGELKTAIYQTYKNYKKMHGMVNW
jgi:hypothetical protein